MSGKPFWTRRGFLRSALGSMALSAAQIDAGLKGVETEAGPATEETTVVAQLRLSRELYDRGAVVDGTISYRVPPARARAGRLGGWVRADHGPGEAFAAGVT